MVNKPSEPNEPQSWESKSAVERRLSLSGASRKLEIGVLLFLLGPFVLFAVVAVTIQSGLGIIGIPLMIVGGLAAALAPFVIGGIILWTAFKAFKGRVQTTAAPAAAFVADAGPVIDEETNSDLAPVLAELSRLQEKLAGHRRLALRLAMPVVLVLAVAACYGVITTQPRFDLIPVALVLVLPIALAYVLIPLPFQNRFKSAFKTTVLPTLLSRYGDLRQQDGHRVWLGGAMANGAVPKHTTNKVDDAFIGRHRGYDTQILDMLLLSPDTDTASDANSRKTQHRVLAILLTLDRPVPAQTVVLDSHRDKSYHAGPGEAMRRVDLEDVVFSSVYEVWSTDQVGARVLLTPAIMTRLIEVADNSDFMPPTLYAVDNTFQIFLKTINERDLFEPASVALSNMGVHLRTIDKDLSKAFAIADTIIEMVLALPTAGSVSDKDQQSA